MSAIRTYKRILLAIAVALVVALSGVAHSSAWANVGRGYVGIELNVPSTAQQAPDAGSSSGSGTSGSSGWLGIELEVPDTSDDRGEGSGGGSGYNGGASTSGGWLGIELNVPSTAQQAPEPGSSSGSGSSGSHGWLGIELNVPDTVDSKGEGSGTGSTGGAANSAGWLGIELNVPSTVEQLPQEPGSENIGESGTGGWLGIELQVQEGLFVSFDANGGENAPSLEPCVIGHTIDEPKGKPSWPGRDFTGWYTVKDIEKQDPATNKWDFKNDLVSEHMSEGGMTLYAGWDWKMTTGKVTLNLVDPNGELTNPKECGIVPPGYEKTSSDDKYVPGVYEGTYYLGGGYPELDSTLELPRAEYGGDGNGNFVSWYKKFDESAEGDARYSDGPYTAIGRYDAGDENGDQEFFAKWEYVQMHTVEFDLNYSGEDGQPAGMYQTKRVKHGTRVGAPSVSPTREGYDFTGWYLTPTCSAPWTPREVTSDSVVYAGWSIKKFTVSFDTGENGSKVSSQTVPWKGNATRPASDPVRAGYVFTGWFSDKECTSEFSFGGVSIESDTTVYAGWEAQAGPWSVVFDTSGGSKVSTQTIADGDKARKPADPTWKGHRFAGWYGADGSDEGTPGVGDGAWGDPWNFDTVIRQDTTIYARWIETVAATFDTDGGSFVDASFGGSVTVDKGGNVYAPEVEREGYSFVMWIDEYGAEWTSGSAVSRDMELTAVWLEHVTVTFDPDGGEFTDDAFDGSITVDKGDSVYAPDVEREGYTFVMWVDEYDVEWTSGSAVDRDMCVTAVWEENLQEYSFAFAKGIDEDDKARPGGDNDVADNWLAVFSGHALPSGVKSGDSIGWWVDPRLGLFAIDDDGNAIAPHRAGYRFAGFYGSHVESDSKGNQRVVETKYLDVDYEHVCLDESKPEDEREYATVARWVVDDYFAKGGDFVWRLVKDAGEDNVVVLTAKWDLRLDVTVPMSVGVGVSGNDGGVTTPEMGQFKVKSRTVVPVSVDQVDLATDLMELSTFFEERSDPNSDSADGTHKPSDKPLNEMDNHENVLKELVFWLAENRGYEAAGGKGAFDIEAKGIYSANVKNQEWSVSLPVRQEEALPTDVNYGFKYTHRNFEELAGTAKAKWFTIDPFDIWTDGAKNDAHKPLELKLGMEYPDSIQVKLFGEGDRPLTHMVFTVSAKEYQKQ